MVYLSTFGQYDDCRFDNTYITIWYVHLQDLSSLSCTATDRYVLRSGQMSKSARPLSLRLPRLSNGLFKGIFDCTMLHKSNGRYVIRVPQDHFGGRDSYSHVREEISFAVGNGEPRDRRLCGGTESQEAIVRPDGDDSISRTFSVSVH